MKVTTILTRKKVKRMKIQANDSQTLSQVKLKVSNMVVDFIDSVHGTTFDNLFEYVLGYLGDKYEVLGCTFIGDWESDSQGRETISTLFATKMLDFMPNLEMILGEDFTSGIVSELLRSFGGTDTLKVNGMTELSPITATLGEINTPDGKTIRNETDTYGKTETVSDPDMQMKMREMYSQYKTIVSMVDYCYRSLLDEYTKLY